MVHTRHHFLMSCNEQQRKKPWSNWQTGFWRKGFAAAFPHHFSWYVVVCKPDLARTRQSAVMYPRTDWTKSRYVWWATRFGIRLAHGCCTITPDITVCSGSWWFHSNFVVRCIGTEVILSKGCFLKQKVVKSPHNKLPGNEKLNNCISAA